MVLQNNDSLWYFQDQDLRIYGNILIYSMVNYKVGSYFLQNISV